MYVKSRTVVAGRFGLLGFATMLACSGLLHAQPASILPSEIPLDPAAIYKEMQPSADYADTTEEIIDEMVRNHYSHIRFDDGFSGKMLDSYIKSLDGGRMYFTQTDINEFEQYRTQLDDLLQDGDVEAGFRIFNRYNERLIERLVYSIQRVEVDQTDFDFSVDESLEVDRSEVAWAADEAALKDLWRRQVKSAVLSLKLTDKPITEVRELLGKRFRSQLSQVLRTNELDVYQRYMDAMTMTFDPHTQYYAPRAAENFNMSMRLSLEGIGAVLTTEDEYTKVVSVVTGGPADQGGELHPEDRIVGVAQGDNAFVDVIGWRVDDVVDLVRGEKGSVVRLNVLPEGSALESKVVTITRDTVKLEDSSAKKEIVEVESGGTIHKIGVISLPTFYIDFEALQRRDPDYRSSVRDVKRLLEELKTEQVEAVVVDLRGNGGGSLSEASELVGLFVRQGPTVQVKDAEGEIAVLGNPDSDVTYSGPLAVLVNRLSASASEIFAGAIQDYQRGVILGSQTFGKGTVQELIPLGDGQIKITRSKFYRISGASTQHKGVTPNIMFPDIYDVSDDIGESALPTALPWDTIDANMYRPYTDMRLIVPTLNSRHDARLKEDPDFVFIRAEIAKAKEDQAMNELTLNEQKLLAERAERDEWRLQLENTRRAAKGLEPLADIAALDKEQEGPDANAEVERAEGAGGLEQVAPVVADEDAEKKEEADPYLVESGRILLDMIALEGNGSRLATVPPAPAVPQAAPL
ncbi:MAG: carboxy terminal-processing peptidase [Pseudomonadota bacterium]